MGRWLSLFHAPSARKKSRASVERFPSTPVCPAFPASAIVEQSHFWMHDAIFSGNLFGDGRSLPNELRMHAGADPLKPRSVQPPPPQLVRLRRRFEEILAMDFFESKQRAAVQILLDQLTPSSIAFCKAGQGRRWNAGECASNVDGCADCDAQAWHATGCTAGRGSAVMPAGFRERHGNGSSGRRRVSAILRQR
jgi:hypothetical protein